MVAVVVVELILVSMLRKSTRELFVLFDLAFVEGALPRDALVNL